ncbi:MAG: hypothetical protein IJV35_08865 [Neisseriaceae bacterium]|nr:hypothetical protein [Neisseriaceae bacterium]
MNDENPYEAPKSDADDIPEKKPSDIKAILTLLVVLFFPPLGIILLLFWVLPIPEKHKTKFIVVTTIITIILIIGLWFYFQAA